MHPVATARRGLMSFVAVQPYHTGVQGAVGSNKGLVESPAEEAQGCPGAGALWRPGKPAPRVLQHRSRHAQNAQLLLAGRGL